MNDRRAVARRLAPAVLLAAIAVALVVPELEALEFPRNGDLSDAWQVAVEELPQSATVLVGFDPDVGTYPEIRPAVRTALAALLAADARLVTVTLTPEGRALLNAELDRLERQEANPQRLLDLGFVPGAEAALVAIARGPSLPGDVDGAIARRLDELGAGAFDAVVVVGGNDIGPRSWVEQYLPRVDPVPLLAITPTVLLPDVLPFLETGQIDALIGTARAAAAYASGADVGTLERLADRSVTPALAVFVGMLAAGGLLAPRWVAAVRRARVWPPGPREEPGR